MTSTSPETWELARRLIALEAKHDAPQCVNGSEAASVLEKLRLALSRFAGVAGYRSLISRALALAKAEASSLKSVQVQLDGALEGFQCIEQKDEEAGTLILVYLLSLLATFIGKPITVSLIRDVWPDASLDENDMRQEKQS
jgi:hypothetical protein